MPAVNAGTSGAKPKYCRRKVQYAVRTSPRHVATCNNDANGAKHAVEATTDATFLLHSSTWCTLRAG
jgi:hypothetical protein